MSDFLEIWSYLAENQLLWLSGTLAAYVLADKLFRTAGRTPYLNPVLISVLILACLLWLTDTSFPVYFEGAQFIHFMLGPATVALAVPLFINFARVRKSLLPILAALFAGSLTAIISAVGIAWALGISGESLLSLAPKSATAPVAMGISDSIGGSPTLTAVLVLLTGVIGAVAATPLLNLLRIKDWRARGFATGVAAHGIGTARAFQVNDTAGAFAAVGMGLNALLTALLVPLLIALML
ncbi:LrgB family protein [Nitrincola alkalilacustris]|uniref:LrgB family protein n=1 Tax=Nitrincola alkalilacustris TaxID=1571224 RepID=UPI00124E5476|nr:LrgB family protein [Nitrincola alkalilacustris]